MEIDRSHAQEGGKQDQKRGSGMESSRAQRQRTAKNDVEVQSGPRVADGWRDEGWCEGDGSQHSEVEMFCGCPMFFGGIKGNESSKPKDCQNVT